MQLQTPHPRSAAIMHALHATRLVALVLLAALAMVSVGATQTLTWFDAKGPTLQAIEATTLLRQAFVQGLDPADYNAQALTDAIQNATQADDVPEYARERLDAALTTSMQLFLADLQTGRVAPDQVNVMFKGPQRPRQDAPDLLRTALAPPGLSRAVQAIARQLPMAQPLQDALRQYRALAIEPGWQTPLPLPAKGKLVTGELYPALDELVRRLVAVGDLQPPATAPNEFDQDITEAVRRFQLRHGLEPDGIIGRLTLAQLNVTPAQRVRQIELTMERLRWTPLTQARRMIVVNVPEFMLRAYTVHPQGVEIDLEMKIIVGKALDTRTPLSDEEMRYIEFSPYWNVPRSIALRETLPRLRKDPGYFDRQGFEFVSADGTVVRTLTDAHIASVQQGSWRIRQRPGPSNALGAIKFILPNNASIYLHHTPTLHLFERTRRDFSHGCIRVAEPVALAQFVLQDEPEWTQERIEEAMASGTSRTIRLRDPLPVLIAYSTVVIKQGVVYFLDDLYGHDRILDAALKARSEALQRASLPALGL